MQAWNRRDVIRAATAGAALVGGAAAAGEREGCVPRPRRAKKQQPAATLPLAGEALGLSPVLSATVAMCRSFAAEVWLEVADGCAGFVTLEPRGFVLAAAAQASGRPLWIRYWGYNPEGAGGRGQFAGAWLALDASDLLPAEDMS
jgi:hypothetical protein